MTSPLLQRESETWLPELRGTHYRHLPCRSLALVSSGGPFVAGGATAPAGWASFGEGDAFGGGPGPFGGGAFPALEGPLPASLAPMAATAPAGAFGTGSDVLE